MVVVAVAVVLIGATVVGFGSPAGATPSWSIMASPNPPACMNCGNVLFGVSCASATNCMAVGSETLTFVRRSKDTGWSVVASYPAGGALLRGVSCATVAFCMAVGISNKTLVEGWNGTNWSIVPSPVPGDVTTGSGVDAVSCTSVTFCMAVGSYAATGTFKMLVEEWDGSRWSIVPSPAPPGINGGTGLGAYVSYLSAVSCTSTTNCTAVGQYMPSYLSSVNKTLVEHWNRTRWSLAASPNPPRSTYPALGGVSCTGATNCVAVGSYHDSTDGTKTLVEQRNGTRWKIVASPNPTAPNTSPRFKDACTSATTCDSTLLAVSCTSATACFAVGNYSFHLRKDFSGPLKTLVERWNGTRWSIIASPNRPGAVSDLDGVSCANTTNCTAVGASNPPAKDSLDASLTLAERYA
jgi:hypothetical protein